MTRAAAARERLALIVNALCYFGVVFVCFGVGAHAIWEMLTHNWYDKSIMVAFFIGSAAMFLIGVFMVADLIVRWRRDHDAGGA